MLTDDQLAGRIERCGVYDPTIQQDPYPLVGQSRERCPVALAATCAPKPGTSISRLPGHVRGGEALQLIVDATETRA